MIHVCFPLHDKNGNYSKYEGVAIYSILKKTKGSVTIHLLHDETLRDKDKKRFEEIVNQHHQHIIFYEINGIEFSEWKESCIHYTIGTLFRLKMPDILPDYVDKVIYLDADLLFNLDIIELWKIDLDDNIVAGCLDTEESRKKNWLCRTGMIPFDNYFNAGVLVLNLNRIRSEYHLKSDSMDFLQKYPECTFCDQDAMNFLFCGKVKFIDVKYNLFTFSLRRDLREDLVDAVYHYAGDYVHVENPSVFDRLFLSYFIKTPWGNQQYVMNLFLNVVQKKREQKNFFQNVMKCFMKNRRKKIIFGAKSVLNQKLLQLLDLDPDQDYYLDNDTALQGSLIHNIPVHSPEKIRLEERGQYIIIVLSKNHYVEIKTQLQGYGLHEWDDFFDGLLLTEEKEMGLS